VGNHELAIRPAFQAAVPELTESYRAAMRRVASTVMIVTCCDHGRRYGMTATAVTSVSVEPPTLLACVNRNAGLHAFLQTADYFCVNVLRGSQTAQAAAFSGALQGESRFAVGEWHMDSDGTPYLADAQANLFCRKVGAIAHASHTIFLGEVFQARVLESIEPLLYNDGAYATAQRREAPPSSN
jgi:flavin reductase (DIM6/NTAB) family NADH-FMN oxidoreductase RutF